jgi:hypothetical protein
MAKFTPRNQYFSANDEENLSIAVNDRSPAEEATGSTKTQGCLSLSKIIKLGVVLFVLSVAVILGVRSAKNSTSQGKGRTHGASMIIGRDEVSESFSSSHY